MIAMGMVSMLLILAGCSNGGSSAIAEKDETAYKRGQRMLDEQRPDEALAAFLNVIEQRPHDAAESHLEAGRIYLETMDDPVSAIFHFRRFLEYAPDSERESLVRQMILTAEKRFATQLPGKPLESKMEQLELLQMLDELRKENDGLKQQLASLRQERTEPADDQPTAQDTPVQTGDTQQPASPPELTNANEYVVQPGDNLYSISRKVYGTNNRWMDIFQANRDQLPSPDSVQVGQRLRIPR